MKFSGSCASQCAHAREILPALELSSAPAWFSAVAVSVGDAFAVADGPSVLASQVGSLCLSRGDSLCAAIYSTCYTVG